MPEFESMNETDVRETIVRPLLERLGYAHGTENTIRTELPLRYAKTFLGRKNAAKDPPLSGRADYILEIASVGRWVVEVKAPGEELNRDTVEQAFTYAAHPEVAALFFMITNGRSFQLYRTSYLEQPTLYWNFEETEEKFLLLANLVGPEAIRRKMEILKPDTDRPLGLGLGARIQIIGGWVEYTDHISNHPLLNLTIDEVSGLRLPITAGEVARNRDGLLHANIHMAKAMPMAGEISKFIYPSDGYNFYCSDDLLSNDCNNPTKFKNVIYSAAPAGTQMNVTGSGAISLPFGFRIAATSEAVGFVEGDVFKGTMDLEYQFAYVDIAPHMKAAMEELVGAFPDYPYARGGGFFEVRLLLR